MSKRGREFSDQYACACEARADLMADDALEIADDDGHKLPLQMSAHAEIRWVEASYHAIHQVLVNPVYAGAYVYGKIRGLACTSPERVCAATPSPLSGVMAAMPLCAHPGPNGNIGDMPTSGSE